jgi:hypothetical protein
MKTIFLIFTLFCIRSAWSQKGNELLVYSLKGNVTVVENNKESKVRIGKVLKPGSTVKTQKLSKLTMVCKQGKPISVTKEGSFPVEQWKDSCTMPANSMTTKYFQFIWDQLYVRSDDYKKEHPDGGDMLTDAPVRGQEDLEILVDGRFDSIYYASGKFPLKWTTTKNYEGKFYFSLYNERSNKLVFKDSVRGESIKLEKIKKYMRTGNDYSWSLGTSATGEVYGGVIKYISTAGVTRQVNKLKKMVDVPEEPAVQYFRLGYLLENTGFTPNAFLYYQKAASAAPEISLYQEKLDEFKKDFGL